MKEMNYIKYFIKKKKIVMFKFLSIKNKFLFI